VKSARPALVNSARLRLAARFACGSLRAPLANENAPLDVQRGVRRREGGGYMMGGERLDISVRNVSSTAAP
jgi:hypothetical protein